jgi:hypothetical protein
LVNRGGYAKICGSLDFGGEIMRFQTFGGLFLLIFLFLFPAARAQEQQAENSYAEGTTRTAIFDRFPALTECDLRGRLDSFLVALRDNPAAKGYIIFYRGADEAPAQQTDVFAVRVLNLYANHVRLRRFPPERVFTLDGGFRATSMTELWFVPPGGEMPKPSDTIEKPAQPKNKALLVESNIMELPGAEIPEPEESGEETESQQETVENREAKNEVAETETEAETEPEVEFFEWTSGYFAELLKTDKSVKGRVIFYLDETVYDLAKARAIVERGMRNLAKESETDLSRVKIIFGGYRESPEIEFWAVPRGAKKPKPTPEERKSSEELKSEN